MSRIGDLRAAPGRLERIDKRVAHLERHLEAVREQVAGLSRSENRYEAARVRAGRLDYDGADVYLGLDTYSSYKRLRSVAKEPWTARWIEEWIKPGEVLYDIGANVGAYALIAALSPRVQATVVAFEPGYATYAALADNVVLNDAEGKVIPMPVALSDANGLQTLNLRTTEAGGALHSLGPGEQAGAYAQPVLSFRLDDLVAQFELPAPAHVKIDVDGHEAAVVRGARESLTRDGLRSVLCELQPGEESGGELATALADAGLTLRERFERENAGPGTPAYGLYVPA